MQFCERFVQITIQNYHYFSTSAFVFEDSKWLHWIPAHPFLLNIINIVLCIIWLPGAAAVPDVQGPLTLLQCNLAGNARTLLTLLLFANSLHYSLAT